MIVRMKHLQEAEAALDEAMNELHRFSKDPDSWPGHERINEKDRKVLVLHKAYFTELERLNDNVTRAANRLRAVQSAFGGGS